MIMRVNVDFVGSCRRKLAKIEKMGLGLEISVFVRIP